MLDGSQGISLDIVDLHKTYGPTMAVGGVDLSIQPGEFVSLLGPSGSGKTTTLSIVAGFVAPTSGTIWFGDRDVTRLPPHRRNLGMVFQNYALFPTMSVGANVGFPLRQRGVRGAERQRRVQEALALVELDHLSDRRPHELSGGQQQRVALARALVHRPPLLLMDEPLGALDRRLRDSLQTEIAQIHRQIGTTVVYVTHDQDEALSLSDRIAIFSGGRIVQIGTPEEVYRTPMTDFVARFVGDSNIFTGAPGPDTELRMECGATIRTLHPRQPHGSSVLVRPERIRVQPMANDPASTVNELTGTVVSDRYLGSRRLLSVEVPGIDDLVLANTPAGLGDPVHRGDKVLLAWSPDDAVWLNGDSVAPAPVTL